MKRLMLPFLMVWMTFFSQHLFAQASDDASDAVYDSNNWPNTSNGGTGFGAWTLTTKDNNLSTGGFFVGSSSEIDTDGRAWGMYANNSDLSTGVRAFSNPLLIGDVFSISMDNSNVQSGGTVGFGLQNSSDENLFEFFFVGGATQYTVNDGNGASPVSQDFTTQGLKLYFVLTGIDSYQLTIVDLNANDVTVYDGTLFNPSGGQTVSQVRLFNANAGAGSTHNLYFNSLSVQTDANRPTVELANVSGTVANATLLDSKAGDLGIVRIEVKQLQDATLTVDSNAANLNDVIAKQLVSSVPVSVTATGAEPQVRLLITDVAGNETVWFFDFLNM